MPASKIKITKNDILLFLTNELEGEKAAYISNIDEKLAGELNSVADKETKESLAKYRRVDDLLSKAADSSFEMPVSLEKKVNAIIASKTKIQKKTASSIFDKITALFNAANLWSLLGGGAAATLGMLSIIQIQPDLLINRFDMREDQLRYRQAEVLNSLKTGEFAGSGCGIVMDGNWLVAENFLVQIPICKSSSSGEAESTLGETDSSLISDGKDVRVGKEFRIYILPHKDIQMRVTYLTEHGQEQDLLQKTELKSGRIHQLPAEEKPFEFTLPTGQDTIIWEVNGKKKLSVKININ